MTFEDDYSAYWVYFVNFLGTLAVLPGNIVAALLMDKIGRLSMLGETDIWFCCRLYHFADVFEIHTFCYVWKNSFAVNILCFVRVFHDFVWYQLLLPVVWQQWVDDDWDAVLVQWAEYLCLELPGCCDSRAVPYRQKVGLFSYIIKYANRHATKLFNDPKSQSPLNINVTPTFYLFLFHPLSLHSSFSEELDLAFVMPCAS